MKDIKRFFVENKIMFLNFLCFILIVGGFTLWIERTFYTEEVTGIIIDYRKRASDEDINSIKTESGQYRIYYEYEIDGVIYEGHYITNYNSRPRIGGQITVYYDPNDPSTSALSKGSPLGLPLLITGFVLVIVRIVRYRRTKKTILEENK